MLGVLENLPTPISRPLGSSRADWHQHQKVWAQKLEKCEGGVLSIGTQIFEIKKIKEYDAKNRLQIGSGEVGENSTFLIDTLTKFK